MRRDGEHDREDRAILWTAMAAAYHAVEGDAVTLATLQRMESLYHRAIEPTRDGDRAALAILAPGPSDADPVTPEERAQMGVCPTCGGAGGWEVCAGVTQECHDCNGTGRRGG